MDEDLLKLTDELQLAAQCIPNLTHPDVPIGGEDCSTLRKMVCTSLYIYCTPFNKLCVSFFFILYVHLQVGNVREFSFPIKDHVQLGKDLDLFDFDSAAEVIF